MSRRQSISPAGIYQLAVCLLLLSNLLLLACGESNSPIARAKRFYELREQRRFDAARAMMAADARIWYQSRNGEGEPWRLDGPWSTWDSVFNARLDLRDWTEVDSSVKVVSLVDSDFYRMIERAPQEASLTIYFDSTGLINGQLIESGSGDPPPDKLGEFVEWAQNTYPVELAYVMPEGRLNPGADRAIRLRRLLYEWRSATGRAEVL